MKVLLSASECAPFVKTGGLADVVGALPKALSSCGVEARVVLPLYRDLQPLAKRSKVTKELGVVHGGKVRVHTASEVGVSLLLVDAPHLFDRNGGPYLDSSGKDWPDNAIRFAALSEVTARLARDGVDGWRPDLVHVHDWQTGLAPWYLRQWGHPVATVITIHNIAFQGAFEPSQAGLLGLDPDGFTSEGYEFWGYGSMLKAGLVAADRVTTVSPTYAREIMTSEFGMGFEGLLQSRAGDLSGILNGIDTETWNPANDASIAEGYSIRSLKRKYVNRAVLEERFALKSNPVAPLFCVVSRLTHQKGFDLLLEALPRLIARGARLAVLGSGDAELEAAFKQAAVDYSGRVGTIVGYDEPLSHLMQAGADAILIPSRFEPCGLTQLYGLRYGTLPVVARTGGLADTVIDANHAALEAGCATGFQFSPVTTDTLIACLDRCCDLFRDQKAWAALMRNAMRHPVGWDSSSAQYSALYARLVQSKAEG